MQLWSGGDGWERLGNSSESELARSLEGDRASALHRMGHLRAGRAVPMGWEGLGIGQEEVGE